MFELGGLLALFALLAHKFATVGQRAVATADFHPLDGQMAVGWIPS
jgi:hypothetical protein